jgi:hypothetical protein
MTDLHADAGYVVIAVNLLAGLAGTWLWWRRTSGRVFWILLRLGQALVVLEGAEGAILVLGGHDLPRLHLIYGLVPLAVAFIAEQLRVAAAQSVLDQRKLDGAAAVAKLPEPEQHELVRTILRRETGTMAASALVVAFLAMRAQGWLI